MKFIREADAHYPNFTGEIEELCQLLQKQPSFIDDEGYEQAITAASIDKERNRSAWIEVKEREGERYTDINYYLNVMVNNRLIIRWEVETYNPFFGCYVQLLYWMENHLIFIYHEKHHTFACSFPVAPHDLGEPLITEPDVRHQIPDKWILQDKTLSYHSSKKGRIKTISLPELCCLDS